jgi:DNA-binding NtrC family response regulator
VEAVQLEAVDAAQKDGSTARIRPRVTVLAVDDDATFQDLIESLLADYRIFHAYTGRQALAALRRERVDIVLLDLNLPDIQGLRLLETIRAEAGDAEVLVLTGSSDTRHAVEAVKKGAFDFLVKSGETFLALDDRIQRALSHRQQHRDQVAAAFRNRWLCEAFGLLERSRAPAVTRLMAMVRRIADTPLTVLIEGESGVGKEILARYIHAHSRRSAEPFVAAHLAAMPASLLESYLFGHVKGAFTGADRARAGKFELANSGTLFLDEIGELDANAQVKMLRVLQEREIERIGAMEAAPVDVRVVAATNKNLSEEVRARRFREDLFYRLNVIRIEMPPLRQRTEDIGVLLELFSAKHAVIMGREPLRFSPQAVALLEGYAWPGNVRELENLVMRLIAVHPGPDVTAEDIPPEYGATTLPQIAARALEVGLQGGEDRLYFQAREQFERYLVRMMIDRFQGDKRAAARALGVSYSTVKEKSRGEADAWPPL